MPVRTAGIVGIAQKRVENAVFANDRGGNIMRLRPIASLIVALLLFITPIFAQHHSSSRPNYGGGKHTKSHGGHYQGERNSHHKGGHYKNPRTADQYGRHKQ
jgi:hypothetical protein